MPLLRRFSTGCFSRVLAGCLILSLLQDPAMLLAAASPWLAQQARPRGAAPDRRRTRRSCAEPAHIWPPPRRFERIQAIGVKKWIEMQLNPEQIDDSLLEARLQSFPAMRLSQQDLLQGVSFCGGDSRGSRREEFPSPPIGWSAPSTRTRFSPTRKSGRSRRRKPRNSRRRAHCRWTQTKAAAANESVMADAMALEDVASSPSITVHEQKLYADLASTQIVNLSPDQRLERLVSMKPGQIRGFMKGLTPEERSQLTAGMTAQQKETVVALLNPTLLVAGELLQTRLLTDVYSQRQLQAVMTDFWLNHFNVYLKKGQFAPWYLVDYEQNVIAPHAMGKFEDLLVATAKSPAMLFYLDNHTSIGPHSMAAMRAQANPAAKNRDPGLNENYARELMELHTLGVDGGYTQKDVTEVAKVFTGWTIEDPRKGGGFTFNERRHEPGAKVVMGEPSRRMASRRVWGAAPAGDQPGDGAPSIAAAGGALCKRHSAAGAGGPHGKDLPALRWRHPPGIAHDVYFAGVLVPRGVSRQGKDSGRVRSFRGAGNRG